MKLDYERHKPEQPINNPELNRLRREMREKVIALIVVVILFVLINVL